MSGDISIQEYAPMKLHGQCSCGEVSYELSAEPMFVHACHCSLCKQQTGSAFIAHAFIESAHFHLLSGNLNSVFGASGSGNPHEVDRCKSCGTAIISYYEGQRDWGVVKVGTLKNPDRFPPGAHLHVKQKVSWITIPEGIPAFEAGYDFESVWPSDGYARFMQFF
jgi:hypothetical protein